jgi:hypothetical protein
MSSQPVLVRRCPFKGCKVKIASHIFACRHHERQLTADEKFAAWRLYDKWKSGKIGLTELRAGQTELLTRWHEAQAGKGVQGQLFTGLFQEPGIE